MRALVLAGVLLAAAAAAAGPEAPVAWGEEDLAWLEWMRGMPAPDDHGSGLGQAVAGRLGTALLLDGGGNDIYIAPGLATQGFVPENTTAVALLHDVAGNDTYTNPNAGNNKAWVQGRAGAGVDGLSVRVLPFNPPTICVRPTLGCL